MTPESPAASPVPHAPQRPRWRLALLVVLAVSGWVVAGVMLDRSRSKSRPGATAVFHVAAHRPTLLFPVETDVRSSQATQAALIRRRLTLNTALKEPGVADLAVVKAQPDPLAWLEESLHVSFDAPEIMRVDLDGEPADELVTVLNALARVYLKELDDRDNGARRERLQKLEEQNQAYRARIADSHKQIDTIALALGSRDGQSLAMKDAMMRREYEEAIRQWQAARDEVQLKERVEALEKAIGNVNHYRLELDSIRSEIAQTEKLQKAIAETIERIKIELAAPPRVTLLEDAAPRRAR